METLIQVLTAIIDFFFWVAKSASDSVKPAWNVETLMVIIMLLVSVAGIAANGLWKKRPGSGGRMWDE